MAAFTFYQSFAYRKHENSKRNVKESAVMILKLVGRKQLRAKFMLTMLNNLALT